MSFRSPLRLSCVVLPILVACCTRQPPEPAFRTPKKVVDLSPVVTPGLLGEQYGPAALAAWNMSGSTEFRHVVADTPPMYVKTSYITLFDHVGPHGDAPGHVIRGGKEVHEMPLGSYLGVARVLDFTDRDDDEPLLVDDFRAAQIQPKDIVIAVVGYQPPQADEGLPSYPYLSSDAAEYLASIPVRAFATDMPSVSSLRRTGILMKETLDPERLFPEHLALLRRGIPIIEGLANAEQLIGEDQVFFMGFPLRVQGATGGLMRPVALIY